jgi:hypothetical protein
MRQSSSRRSWTSSSRKRRQQIEKRIFQVLESDETLSGDKAIQAWLELHAVFRLENHLRRRIQLGEAASSRIREHLEGPEEPPTAPKTRFRHT